MKTVLMDYTTELIHFGRSYIAKEGVAAIVEMRSQGLLLRRIVKKIGIHHGTVAQYVNN